METLLWVHRVFSCLLVISVLLPFVPSDHWTVRVFDYPRIQKFTLVLVCLLSGGLLGVADHRPDAVLQVLLVAAAGHLLWLIWPYTPFGRVMVRRVRPAPDEPTLRMLVCNVLQHNRAYARMAELIAERDPDVVFLLETDAAWQQGIAPAVAHLEHRMEVPLDNTYGLLLYSRIPLQHGEVRYLIDDEVPSITADLMLAGQVVRFHGLHPTPPVPQENPESTERDAEVLIVGREAGARKGPVVVFGDLNDVAWSHTTRLFMRISGLLDPRRGRGMFSTFHTRLPFLRWPLDHFFVSGHFRLVDMRVERDVGSDHFPISLTVVLRSEDDTQALEADTSDHQEATEKIADGKEKADAAN
jgi:endonuclease/exonuclease/phosphatase (EEP) superfamily protein YafD